MNRRYKAAVEQGGVESLFDKSRRQPNLKNRVDDLTEQSVRLRHVQFGSNDSTQLLINRPLTHNPTLEPTVTANDSRPVSELVRLQGLPEDFDIPAFTRGELVKAIDNGVPYPMAVALAQAVKFRSDHGLERLCACHCGRLYINAPVKPFLWNS